MLSVSSVFVFKFEELYQIIFFYSPTGLERSTTREDQMVMIFTGRMCLISGWNSVTQYGVYLEKFVFLAKLNCAPLLCKFSLLLGLSHSVTLEENSNLYVEESEVLVLLEVSVQMIYSHFSNFSVLLVGENVG